MAVRKVVPQEKIASAGEKTKLKARFTTAMRTANTVEELKKCLKILSRHVFDEKDGE